MSSFRIDRQYVSFETAETQPVRAKTPQQAAAADEDKPSTGMDLAQLYNEIYERLRSEHAEQAEYMLSKAADEAAEIVEKAKRQAEEILTRAQCEAARLREELLKALEDDASQRQQREEEELTGLEAALRNDYFKLVEGMRGEIVALVMEIVKKIIAVRISQSDEVFMGLIGNALERLKQAGTVVIRVSPEDYQRYFGSSRADIGIDTGDVRISVAEDPGFTPGDLVVESEGEIVDLSINRQIDLIETAFQG
jgi:flagellar biosynthesis/type III secretory pathway protein FliH